MRGNYNQNPCGGRAAVHVYIFFIYLIIQIFAPHKLPADSGFFVDLTLQYIGQDLNGISPDKVQGLEPALNGGYQFNDNFGLGLFTNVSLGVYAIFGDLREFSGPRYNTALLQEDFIFRFDIQPYFLLSNRLSYWFDISLGIGPEISIYQYKFNDVQFDEKDIVGTFALSLGLMPQIQFHLNDNIIFGVRMHIVPFTFYGRSMYVTRYGHEEDVSEVRDDDGNTITPAGKRQVVDGTRVFERDLLDVQNHIFKFGIYVGYFFGKTYYRPRDGGGAAYAVAAK